MADLAEPLAQHRARPPDSAKVRLLLAAGLFLVAWLPRLLDLGAFITWDEPMWVYRSVHFAQALHSGDWAATFRVGHPGVMTTWLGGLGIDIQRLVLGVPSSTEWEWLLQLPALEPDDTEALRRLAPLLVAAKIPVTLATALAVVGCWSLARRLIGAQAALLAGLLLVLDPFLLALSRVLHLDALLASFVTLSLLSLLVYLHRHNDLRWLVFSAVTAGLSILTKTTALLMLPLGAVVLIAGRMLPRNGPRIRSLLLWSGVIIATYVALWPAMWVAPWHTLQGVLDKALGYASEAEETAGFFRGNVVSDPGALFYPLVFLFRASPVTLLGLLGYPLLLRHGSRSERRTATVLLVYGLLYGASMASGAKKFGRYLLPVFPSMTILAALGWSSLERIAVRPLDSDDHSLLGQLRRSISPSGVMLVLTQALLVLPYHPDYLAWYNPLLGGLRQAVRTLPVGWGEGLEKAAAYLNARPAAEQLTVATGGVPGMAPEFQGRTLPLVPASLVEADYVVLYVSDQQRGGLSAYEASDDLALEHVVRLRGEEYAWIYRNEGYRATLELLSAEAEAGDAVLIGGPSLVARHYAGPWPHAVLEGQESESEVASVLQGLAGEQGRIWYVQFAERTLPAAQTADYILASQAYRLQQDGTVSLHQLPIGERFVTTMLEEGDGPFNFGDQLLLARYGIADASIGWGQSLGARVTWRPLRELSADYTAFLHLVDRNGRIWGQIDLLLQDDMAEPTTKWSTGSEHVIPYLIDPWAGTPPGRYELLAGVYRSDTQQLLRVGSEHSTDTVGSVSLGPVQVVPSPLQPTVEELSIPHPLDTEVGGSMRLLGYGVSRPSVRPGASLEVDLFWRVVKPPEVDYALSISLGDTETRLALPNPDYPSSRWQAGQMLRGRFGVLVPVDLPPDEYAIRVDIVEPNGRSVLAEPISLGSIEVGGGTEDSEVASPSHPLSLRLGSRIMLLGYDLAEPSLRPGTSLRVTLYWQSEGATDLDYTVFAHILGEGGVVLSQKDSIPQGGAAPTTGWLLGEVIVDEFEIPVPLDLPSGPSLLEVGMYDAATGQRLPIYDADGARLAGDRVVLVELVPE